MEEKRHSGTAFMVALITVLGLISVYLIMSIIKESENIPDDVRTMNNLMEHKTRACYKSTNRRLCDEAAAALEKFTEELKRKTAQDKK